MMKIILNCCILAALISTSAFAQAPEISVVGRAEALYNVVPSEEADWNMGMSSIYAFVEGNIGESDFSYFASLHLLSRYPQDLYNQQYPLLNCSWLDAAYFTYDNGTLGAEAGKVFYRLGTFEQDEYDVFSYLPVCSDYWYGICGYQYGFSFFVNPAENHRLMAQVTTSPYTTNVRNGDLAYSLSWYGDMGPFSTIWSVGTQRCTDPELSGEEGRKYFWTLGLGNKLSFDRFEHWLDINSFGIGSFKDLKSTSAFWRTYYIGNEHFRPMLMVGVEHMEDLKYGFSLEYMPLKDDSLRIYASASNRHFNLFNGGNQCNVMATVGLMYDLRLSFKKK